jgi:Ser/Thr protein kinase RdoA (MazF antagonist)
MHLVAQDFPLPIGAAPVDAASAREDLARLAHLEQQMRTYLPAPEVLARLDTVGTRLREASARLQRADLPTGMIHGDFVPENLVYPDGCPPYTTDFDDCRPGPLLLDLAAAMAGFAALSGATALEAVLDGYRRLRALTDAEHHGLDAALVVVIVRMHLKAGSGLERLGAALEGWAQLT